MKMLPDSSITIWEKVARKTRTPTGWRAEVPGEYMPDGKPFSGFLLGDKVTAGGVEQFYTAVKGAYDAREKRKEAEADRRALAAADGARRTDRDERSGHDAPASQATAPETQEGVEVYLKSQVARLVERAAGAILERDKLLARVAELEKIESDSRLAAKKLEAAIAALGG